MKSIFSIIILVLFFASCKNSDKKAELESLKKQHDELSEKIKALEEEIAKTDSTVDIQSKFVKVDEVKTQKFEHFIEVQGKVDGDKNVAVNAQTMGIINEIFVHEGDAVNEGQVLAQIDASVLEQGIKELESSMIFVDSLYQKQKRLWEQKIGSEVQYLTAKNNKESLEKKRKTLLEQLEMSKIKSPISGTIEEIPIKIGQSIAPGFPAFRIVNFSTVKINADVSESYSSKIKKGNNVHIYFPDCEKEVSANISFASKYINPINRTFEVEVRLSDVVEMEFRANMIAVIRINDYSADSTVVVPVNLVQKSKNNNYVFIAQNDGNKIIAKKSNVETGYMYNGLAEITKGLNVGDKVITSGYQELMDGQVISY
ncbi:MAG: hypothetical protein A2033_01365 [Bacteroidetes bacterium GWA2_31_9]|nr:MAG: hypothetical protein A2033_01365 [Bacteroidetes bacterium GWA2_31_9]